MSNDSTKQDGLSALVRLLAETAPSLAVSEYTSFRSGLTHLADRSEVDEGDRSDRLRKLQVLCLDFTSLRRFGTADPTMLIDPDRPNPIDAPVKGIPQPDGPLPQHPVDISDLIRVLDQKGNSGR